MCKLINECVNGKKLKKPGRVIPFPCNLCAEMHKSYFKPEYIDISNVTLKRKIIKDKP